MRSVHLGQLLSVSCSQSFFKLVHCKHNLLDHWRITRMHLMQMVLSRYSPTPPLLLPISSVYNVLFICTLLGKIVMKQLLSASLRLLLLLALERREQSEDAHIRLRCATNKAAHWTGHKSSSLRWDLGGHQTQFQCVQPQPTVAVIRRNQC